MINQRNIQTGESGFSLMEITLAMFVLVFGLLGILAVFPVGLDSSRKSIENTTAALIGKSVLEYLRVDGTLSTIADPDGNGTDDNYAPWPGFEQPALVKVSDTSDADASSVETCFVDQMTDTDTIRCRYTRLSDKSSQSPAWSTDWSNHILMLVSGSLRGKVFQIESSGADTIEFTVGNLNNTYSTSALDQDIIEQGTHFVILGKTTTASPNNLRNNTIPQNFFSVTPNLRQIQYEQLETDPNDSNADYAIPADNASESDYSYVCILSGYLPGSPNTAQATILVYRNYQDFHTTSTQRPEQNLPPVNYFTTILTR